MLRRRASVIVDFMITAREKHAGQCVHANGIDIYYVEAGQGEPLLLLDNAMVSTNPVWTSMPIAYASFLGTLAEHFRVIAPDTRGSGKSVHPGGPIPSALLADDVAALIDALTLARPALILIGDRDPFCTVEEGAAACRALPAGQLAVLPGTGHLITPAAVQATIDFFERL